MRPLPRPLLTVAEAVAVNGRHHVRRRVFLAWLDGEDEAPTWPGRAVVREASHAG